MTKIIYMNMKFNLEAELKLFKFANNILFLKNTKTNCSIASLKKINRLNFLNKLQLMSIIKNCKRFLNDKRKRF